MLSASSGEKKDPSTVQTTVSKGKHTVAGTTIYNQSKQFVLKFITSQLEQSMLCKIVAGYNRIPIRKEVVKSQSRGIIAVPLKLRMTLEQFLSEILTIFGGKIWQKKETLK